MFTSLMIIMTYTRPIYFDIKESYNEVGTMIDDLNEIMPDIKKSLLILENICNSEKLRYICGQ